MRLALFGEWYAFSALSTSLARTSPRRSWPTARRARLSSTRDGTRVLATLHVIRRRLTAGSVRMFPSEPPLLVASLWDDPPSSPTWFRSRCACHPLWVASRAGSCLAYSFTAGNGLVRAVRPSQTSELPRLFAVASRRSTVTRFARHRRRVSGSQRSSGSHAGSGPVGRWCSCAAPRRRSAIRSCRSSFPP